MCPQIKKISVGIEKAHSGPEAHRLINAASVGKSNTALAGWTTAGDRSYAPNGSWGIINAFCLIAVILWSVNLILK